MAALHSALRAGLVAGLLITVAPSPVPAPSCTPTTTDTAFDTSAAVGYALVADAGACCAACGAAAPACAAFTFLPATNASASAATLGRCFLLTAGLAPAPRPGAASGALDGASPSSCPFGSSPCPGGGAGGVVCSRFASWCSSSACAPGQSVCPDGVTCVAQAAGWTGCPALPAYLANASLGAAARAHLLVAELSLDEIAPQLDNQGYGNGPPGPPGIERLAVPAYNWLNEGLHGVARSGLATSFPQISVIGCTFNRSVFARMGAILGSEARAKHAMNRRANATTGDYTGVTFYAPNINIGRDPRQYRRRRAET